MSDLLVIVPSRGRPQNIAALLEAWADTKATSDLLVGLDIDDPAVTDYLAIDAVTIIQGMDVAVMVKIGARKGMIGTLNQLARANASRYRHIGFMGDDHRPRTRHWDQRITETLDQLGTGIVYGDDLFQGANLPTAVFLTADLVTRLGYMAPPDLLHMYADNFWLDLGRTLGALRYLPDVIIEHVHPHAGKGEADEGYARVWPLMERDRIAYEHYRDSRFADDVARARP